MSGREITRRNFLERSGFVFCGLWGASSGLLSGCEVHEVIPRLSGGLRRFVTPVEGTVGEEFYLQFGNPSTSAENVPRLAPDEWSLAITGQVDNPVTITYADVVAAAASEGVVFLKTMRCVLDSPGIPLLSNGYWRGVPLAPFLAEASPQAGALRARFTAEDGFTNNLLLTRILDDLVEGVPAELPTLPVMLVFELNGEPIPPLHGGPVRLVVPEKFGFKNMKFPRQLDVTDVDEPFGYYEVELLENDPVGDVGNIELVSVFSGPVEGEAVGGPSVSFFGMAVHGEGGIERVEVSLDGGAFVGAELLPFAEVLADPVLFFGEDTSPFRAELEALNQSLVQVTDPAFAGVQPFVWVLWRFTAELSKGDHQARVRAFGTDGSEQAEGTLPGVVSDSRFRRVRFTVQ